MSPFNTLTILLIVGKRPARVGLYKRPGLQPRASTAETVDACEDSRQLLQFTDLLHLGGNPEDRPQFMFEGEVE